MFFRAVPFEGGKQVASLLSVLLSRGSGYVSEIMSLPGSYTLKKRFLNGSFTGCMVP